LERAERALIKLDAVRARCPTLAAYERDSDQRDIAERNIQVAVEAVIDLSNWLIARKGWPHPATAALSIETLVRRGAVNPRLGRSLIETRRVVLQIDDRKVYRSIRLRRNALRQAIRALSKSCGLRP
jgi:uncharacterized protein YutE (UPF0331/DUF86 family)